VADGVREDGVTSLHLIPPDVATKYEAHEWRNACAVLSQAFPNEWNDILTVLRGFELKHSHIAAGGGGRSLVSQALDEPFYALGWQEKNFDTKIVVDGVERQSPTHKVDCFKNDVGVEIEWNNKDPFYDRDLNNFRLLFELRALAVGVIITRSEELQALFRRLGVYAKYGASTTHMDKLLPRLEGGSGGGCPILVFGITAAVYNPRA
jgi:hypothetical protein